MILKQVFTIAKQSLLGKTSKDFFMGICNLFYIFELLINETKASYIHPNMGRLAKVCFGYKQVMPQFRRTKTETIIKRKYASTITTFRSRTYRFYY